MEYTLVGNQLTLAQQIGNDLLVIHDAHQVNPAQRDRLIFIRRGEARSKSATLIYYQRTIYQQAL